MTRVVHVINVLSWADEDPANFKPIDQVFFWHSHILLICITVSVGCDKKWEMPGDIFFPSKWAAYDLLLHEKLIELFFASS